MKWWSFGFRYGLKIKRGVGCRSRVESVGDQKKKKAFSRVLKNTKIGRCRDVFPGCLCIRTTTTQNKNQLRLYHVTPLCTTISFFGWSSSLSISGTNRKQRNYTTWQYYRYCYYCYYYYYYYMCAHSCVSKIKWNSYDDVNVNGSGKWSIIVL